jgi:hypothetical protein
MRAQRLRLRLLSVPAHLVRGADAPACAWPPRPGPASPSDQVSEDRRPVAVEAVFQYGQQIGQSLGPGQPGKQDAEQSDGELAEHEPYEAA